MRLIGPSADCEGCPVWSEMQESREEARRSAGSAVQLSLMIGA
jgi:hypothetical protein